MPEKSRTVELYCKACKVRLPEPGYDYRLCAECRQGMINRPYPSWIKAFMVIVVLLILLSSYYLPTALQAGYSFRVAKKAEANRDYPAAIEQYQKILAVFPASQKHQARLAICYLQIKDTKKALPLILALDEKKLPDALIEEINGLIEKRGKKQTE
jgi:tetratricopeptide (TPR) repeat protein